MKKLAYILSALFLVPSLFFAWRYVVFGYAGMDEFRIFLGLIIGFTILYIVALIDNDITHYNQP